MKRPTLTFSSKENGYTNLTIRLEDVSIKTHYYSAEEKGRALLTVGGVGGGFDTPAQGLYPTLGRDFCKEAISTLHLKYRYATNLVSCIEDVICGIEALALLGHTSIALIGHSLGGAVVLAAAVLRPEVVSIITLATQSYGAIEAAKKLHKQSLLLIHGLDDRILPPICSQEVYHTAQCPKKLYLLPGTGHLLDEVASDVNRICTDWIRHALK
jgi:hypothetical protein